MDEIYGHVIGGVQCCLEDLSQVSKRHLRGLAWPNATREGCAVCRAIQTLVNCRHVLLASQRATVLVLLPKRPLGDCGCLPLTSQADVWHCNQVSQIFDHNPAERIEHQLMQGEERPWERRDLAILLYHCGEVRQAAVELEAYESCSAYRRQGTADEKRLVDSLLTTMRSHPGKLLRLSRGSGLAEGGKVVTVECHAIDLGHT